MSQLNPKRMLQCVECNSGQLRIIDDDKQICLQCGYVNTVNSKKKGAKYSGNQDKPNTIIPRSANKTQNTRLSVWKQFAKASSSNEKNILEALSEITRLGDHFSVPKNVLEKASDIYRRLLQKRRLHGYKTKILAAAALYISCRNNGFNVSLSNIVNETRNSKKEIAKSIRFIVKELSIKIKSRALNSLDFPYMFTGYDKELAKRILFAVQEGKLLLGKNPDSVHASICYITGQISGTKVTQRELCEHFRTTRETIRKVYQELLSKIDLIIQL